MSDAWTVVLSTGVVFFLGVQLIRARRERRTAARAYGASRARRLLVPVAFAVALVGCALVLVDALTG